MAGEFEYLDSEKQVSSNDTAQPQFEYLDENPQKVSTTDYVMNEAKKGLIDVLSMPGLAVDAAAWVVDQARQLYGEDLPDIDPVMGSDHIRDMLNSVSFTKEYDAPSDEARYMGSMARFTAPALISSPVIAGARAAGKFDAGRVAVTEFLSSILGGLGAEGGADAAEALGFDPQTGRAVGGIAGSLSPLPAQKVISEATGRLRTLQSQDFQRKMGRAKAGAQLETELNSLPEARQNLIRTNELRENIPGFSPSLGRATGAPGIISLEKSLAESSADNLAQAIRADQVSVQAVSNKLAKDFPDYGVNILQAPKQTYKKAVVKLNTDLNKTKKSMENLAASFTRKPSTAIGEQLKILRDKAEADARVIKNMKYKTVYDKADSLNITEDVGDLPDLVNTIITDAGATFQQQNMPSVFSEILTKYSKSNQSDKLVDVSGNIIASTSSYSVPFSELHSLMKRANSDYQRIKNVDPTQAYFMRPLIENLNSRVDKYLGTEYGDVAVSLREANEFWLNDYQNVFRKGVGGKLASYNKFGDVTPDQEVVSTFMNKSKGVEDFFKIYGESDEAYELLKDGVLDMFSKAAVRDGVINKSSAANFTSKYKEQLDRLPEIKNIILDADKANVALIDRQAVLHNKLKKLKGSKLKALAGVNDLDGLLNKVLNNKKDMTSLTTMLAKKSGGVETLAFNVANKISNSADPYKELLNKKSVIKPLMNKLGQDHYKNLETLAEAQNVLKRYDVPRRALVSNKPRDIVEETSGTSFKSLLSQMRAAAQGRVSKEYIMSDIGGKYLFTLKQQEASKLLQAAFYNPKLAEDLAKMSKTVKLTKTDGARIRYHLYSIGAKSNIIFDDDEHLGEEY